MDKELEKLMPEVIEKQKEAVLGEIARYKLHLEFHEKQFAGKTPKNKEEKETLANQKLQTINPIKDKLKTQKAYYEFLCKK